MHRGARTIGRREAGEGEPGLVPQEDQVGLDGQALLHHPLGVIDDAVEGGSVVHVRALCRGWPSPTIRVAIHPPLISPWRTSHLVSEARHHRFRCARGHHHRGCHFGARHQRLVGRHDPPGRPDHRPVRHPIGRPRHLPVRRPSRRTRTTPRARPRPRSTSPSAVRSRPARRSRGSAPSRSPASRLSSTSMAQRGTATTTTSWSASRSTAPTGGSPTAPRRMPRQLTRPAPTTAATARRSSARWPTGRPRSPRPASMPAASRSAPASRATA